MDRSEPDTDTLGARDTVIERGGIGVERLNAQLPGESLLIEHKAAGAVPILWNVEN